MPRRSTSPSPAKHGSSSLPPAQLPASEFDGIDPALHGATLDSVVIPPSAAGEYDELNDDANRLSAFAQHVLTDGPDRDTTEALLAYEGDPDGSMYTRPAAQEFTELLDAERDQEAQALGGREDQAKSGSAERGPEGEQVHSDEAARADLGDDGEEGYHPDEQRILEKPGQGPPPPPERSRRGKRKRDEELLPRSPVVRNGAEVDMTRAKKDNHKEVERRRRENINDGILEIAKLMPFSMDKMGKGAFLRKVAERLAELTAKVEMWEGEQSGKEMDEGAQGQLARLQAQLEEEQIRSMRYETSWREAEDRAAASQFELARAQNELDELKHNFEAEAT